MKYDKYDLENVKNYVKSLGLNNIAVSCFNVYVYDVPIKLENTIRSEYPLMSYSIKPPKDTKHINIGLGYNYYKLDD